MALPPGVDPSKTPLMLNPSGALPDFDNGPSLFNAELGTGISLIAIVGVFLVLRLSTNFKISRKLCLDDWLCLFAYAGGVGYWALNLCLSQRGAARHAWDVPISIVTTTFIKMQVSILFIISPTMWASKAAILALYIRIFGTMTWIRRTSYFWIWFMALFYSMYFVVAGTYCIPRKGEAWGGASFQRCSTSAWIHLVVGVFSCVADIFILVLPFPIVLRLHITVAKKITLSIVFGLGIILVGLSLLSLYYRVIIFRGGEATWNGTALAIVTLTEIFGTVAVSSAPAMSSFWFNILTESKMWTDLKSSFIFSSLRSRSSKQSLGGGTPSFVYSSSRAPGSSKQNLKPNHMGDTEFILRETRFEVVDEDASTKESSHSARQV